MQNTAEFSAVAVHGVTGSFFGPCTQVTRPGVNPAIRAGKGWRGRRELAPRCSATQLGASCGRIWTDTYVKHTVRTTTTTTTTNPTPPSEKGAAEDTLVEPIQEDEDLTPVDESKVTVEKGSPLPEPVLTQDRTALGLEKHKALTAGERPQFMDIRRLGSSRFSPYDSEAKRLRLRKRRERWVDVDFDDEDIIDTSNFFAALANESSGSGQLMTQDG